MNEPIEDAVVTSEKPWTKVQIVVAMTTGFTIACLASVAFDKALEKLFKL